MGLPRYIWYLFLIPGLLLLLGAAMSAYGVSEIQRSQVHTTGYVARTSGAEAEIHFSTPDGQAHTFDTTMSSSRPYRVGDSVPVAYETGEADRARLEAPNPAPWEASILMGCWGGALTLIGGIPLFFAARRRKLEEWLKLNGRAVTADFTGVELNKSIAVNDKNPYRVKAHWQDPATQRDHTFYSPNLWKDPAPHIHSKTITVVIDPNRPERYWMDLSFLPPK